MSSNSEDPKVSSNELPESQSGWRPKWIHTRLGITFVILYTLVVLGGALVASTWLYDWSRLRILDTSSLADLANFDFFRNQGNKPAQQPPSAAAQPAQAGSSQESAPAQPKTDVPAVNILLLGN